MPEPRRVPLGKPLDWSDQQVEEQSQVTPQDIEEARVWAQKNSRPGDGGLADPAQLLDATTQE